MVTLDLFGRGLPFGRMISMLSNFAEDMFFDAVRVKPLLHELEVLHFPYIDRVIAMQVHLAPRSAVVEKT